MSDHSPPASPRAGRAGCGYHPLVRDLVRETALTPQDCILPLFVRAGRDIRKEIPSMPGNYQVSLDRLTEEVGSAHDLGLRSFILFGIPDHKDATGSPALEDEGIIQQALRSCAPVPGSNPADHRRMLLRVHRSRPLRHLAEHWRAHRPGQ